MKSFSAFLILLLGWWAAPQAALAQETAKALLVQELKLPVPFTRDKATEMLAGMDDAEARDLLSNVLYGLTYTPRPLSEDANALDKAIAGVQGIVDGVMFSVRDMLARAPHLIESLATGYVNLIRHFGGTNLVLTVLFVAGAILAGLLAEYVFERFGKPWANRFAPQPGSEPGLLRQIAVLLRRLVLEIGDLIIFFVVATFIIYRTVPADLMPTVDSFFLNLIVVPRLTASLSRFLLSPGAPELRLVHADESTVRILQTNLVAITAFQGFANFLTFILADNQVPLRSTRIDTWFATLTLLWMAIVVWKSRKGLSNIVRGWDPRISPAVESVARRYPALLLAMLFGGWVLINYLVATRRFDLIAQGSHFSTMVLLAAAPVLDTAIRAMSRHLTPPMTGEGPVAMRAWEANKGAFVRIGRIFLVVVIAAWLGAIWEFDFRGLLSVGSALSAGMLKAAAVVAAGYTAWEFTMLLINRKLSQEMAAGGGTQDEDGEVMGAGGGSRLATVLPMVRIGANIAIVVLTLLLALGQVGIDIAPLLAGAGIVGLAIGFGAQTLVKDIVSGLFFLVDDAFRVGDYITIGGTSGTVEKISLRSMQLRHHEGTVHTLPYGEIAQVSNFSRDWVIVKMKFTVTFSTDIRKVKKLFKAIGQDILKEPFAEDIIETFKLQGVGDVNDVGVVIRGKFKAKPGKQWVARKEIYARVHRAFEENGIEFARREVRVNVGGPGAASLDEATRKNLALAAAAGTMMT